MILPISQIIQDADFRRYPQIGYSFILKSWQSAFICVPEESFYAVKLSSLTAFYKKYQCRYSKAGKREKISESGVKSQLL